MIYIIKFELIKDILFMGMVSSLIIVNLVQIIKENFELKSSKFCVLLSFIISIIVGTLFSFTFSYLNFIYCLWSGIISFLSSNFLYKSFENKGFKSYKNIIGVKKD